MSAKSGRSRTSSSTSAGRNGSISSQGSEADKQTIKNPANGLHNEASRKETVVNQRYDSYRIAFYGSAAEKEAYKQQIRSQLKDQVKEKDDLHRQKLIERVAESDQAVANDQKSNQEDKHTKETKANYLKQFSNENKKIMEEKERSQRKTREADTELERKLLTVNPINWNMTLH